MKRMVKIQLPIKAETKLLGEKLADKWGLQSFNDLLRFLAEHAVNGTLEIKISNTPLVEDLTDEEYAVLEKLDKEFDEAEKKGEVFTANSAEELLNHLKN